MSMDLQNKLKMLDGIFTSLLMDEMDLHRFESISSTILSSIKLGNVDKKFTVWCVKTTSEPIFFMRITPKAVTDLTFASEYVESGKTSFENLKKGWESIDDWVVEIDCRMLDKTDITLNPQELTALLLHEIAHTVYSDKVVEKFYRALLISKVKYNYSSARKFKFVNYLYSVSLYTACGFHSWAIGKNGIEMEKKCDEFTKSVNYDGHLYSAFDKIIHAYGNSLVKSGAAQDKELEKDIQWCNNNIADLVSRQKVLRSELVYKASRSSCGPIKSMYAAIASKLGAVVFDKNLDIAKECTVENIDSIFENGTINPSNYIIGEDLNKMAALETAFINIDNTNESALESLFKKKYKLPTDRELDLIMVDIDRIKNHQDRIFSLNQIFNRIEMINEYEEYIQFVPELMNKDGARIAGLRKQLEEMRTAVLNKKNFDKDYALFIKVPEGYEG